MGPLGFEPRTNGLKDRPDLNISNELSSNLDQTQIHNLVQEKVHQNAALLAIARSILNLSAVGQKIPLDLLKMLSEAILNTPIVRLAQQIQGGGPNTLNNALEVSSLLVQQEPASSQLSTHIRGSL